MYKLVGVFGKMGETKGGYNLEVDAAITLPKEDVIRLLIGSSGDIFGRNYGDYLLRDIKDGEYFIRDETNIAYTKLVCTTDDFISKYEKVHKGVLYFPPYVWDRNEELRGKNVNELESLSQSLSKGIKVLEGEINLLPDYSLECCDYEGNYQRESLCDDYNACVSQLERVTWLLTLESHQCYGEICSIIRSNLQDLYLEIGSINKQLFGGYLQQYLSGNTSYENICRDYAGGDLSMYFDVITPHYKDWEFFSGNYQFPIKIEGVSICGKRLFMGVLCGDYTEEYTLMELSLIKHLIEKISMQHLECMKHKGGMA